MHVNIDNWLLGSVFAHLKLANELIGYMCNAAVSDEFTKSINKLQRRAAALLANPYGLHPAEKPDDSQVADESIQDGTARRPELEDVLDDLRDSGERADAFAHAAKDLVEGLAPKGNCDQRQLTDLSHLVGAAFEAIQEITDGLRVLGQRCSAQASTP